jgi:hypothetical protein
MYRAAIFGLSLFLTLVFTSQSMARVDIVPQLVVIESRERAGEIIVVNTTQELGDYELSIIHYRQDENGTYEILEEPLSPLFDPQEIVRMSPQEFQLSSLNRQKVRLALRKPADLPDGEYRFHLVAKGYRAQEVNEPEDNIGVSMTINLAIAIPVVVRHGEVSATGTIGDFELVGSSQSNTGKPELKFTAFREGNKSTLGRIDVSWAPDGQNFENIGFLNHFNVFTEIDKRFGAVPLNKMPRGGTIRVLYTDTQTKEVYDEVVFDL